MKEALQQKYIQHESLGIPIRVPPYLRNEMRQGNEEARIQADMIRMSNHLGERHNGYSVEEIPEEHVRLRRIAHDVSKKLVQVAEKVGEERFCTLVHGSLARGLIRPSTDPDPSDVDIDLVLAEDRISKEKRKQLRSVFYKLSSMYSARVDTYIWTLSEVKRNNGYFARLYLGSSTYPIANSGNLWEEVREVGIENQRFLLLHPRAKQRIRKIVELATQGHLEQAQDQLAANSEIGEITQNFFGRYGISLENIEQASEKLQFVLSKGGDKSD